MSLFRCPWCGKESDYTDNSHWDSSYREWVSEGPILKMNSDSILCRCPLCKGEFEAVPDEFLVQSGYVFTPENRNDPYNCDWYPEDFDHEDMRRKYYVQEKGHQPPGKKMFSLNRRKRCR